MSSRCRTPANPPTRPDSGDADTIYRIKTTNLASQVLRATRRASGVTQRALGARAKARVATIGDIERGAHDPTVGRLDALLAFVGHRLVAVPTRSRPVAEAASAIAGWLAAGRESYAFREVIQLSDDLSREFGATRVALAAATPGFTGDRKWDALIAGVTAHWLAVDRLTQPEWLKDPARTTPEHWYVDDGAPRSELRAQTPRELGRRGVFLAASELASV
jgi:transcriptional regulator with XRE-family HTH domain